MQVEITGGAPSELAEIEVDAEGGIVAASRSILYPEAGATGSAGAWDSAFDQALGAAIDELGAAVNRD